MPSTSGRFARWIAAVGVVAAVAGGMRCSLGSGAGQGCLPVADLDIAAGTAGRPGEEGRGQRAREGVDPGLAEGVAGRAAGGMASHSPGQPVGRQGGFSTLAAGRGQAAQSGVRSARRQDGFAALRSGEYEAAVRLLRPPALQGDADALAGWVRALRETGDYAGAVRAARQGLQAGVEGAGALLGAALLATGRVAEARAALEGAVAEAGAGRLPAEVELGILEYRHGHRDRARALFAGLADRYSAAASGAGLSQPELAAVGRALVHLSRWRYEYAHDALDVLDEAQAAGAQDHGPQIAIGELFLERYDAAQATDAFRQVLAQNPLHARARLGLARAARLEGRTGAAEHLEAALATNPRVPGARSLMARIHLANGDLDRAGREVDRALEANPSNLEALGTRAAIFLLAGDDDAHAAAMAAAREASPAPTRSLVALAELSADHRRYEDAVTFALAAAAADSSSWAGWGLAGLNMVRLGRVAEGRAHLERAFAGDPFNLWFKNTLDLLDALAEYETVETEHFRLVLHESEADLLAPYMARVAERAYREMAGRYGMAPPPIRVEAFRRHADFSVRTVGLTGLGALGVSFGPALAMDSPAARARGQFNWASTLWHEIAHSFHMAVSGNRVPRWFSEGLAVHEQRKGHPTWGRGPSVSFARSLAAGTLRKVGELDRGFSNPRHPAEVSDTYFQASLVFELLEARHGFQSIVDMLHAYRNGASNEEAFEIALGVRLEDFEREFGAHLADRFGAAAAAVGEDAVAAPGDLAAARAAVARRPGRFEPRMILGRALFDEGRLDDAGRHFARALELFPDYGGADGPHWYLGRIREEQGDFAAAIRHYRAFERLNESHYEARTALARLLAQDGDAGGAGTVLHELAHVHPYAIEDRERAAELLEASSRLEDAALERRAVLALDPVDKATAHFRLARLLHKSGDRLGARRAVLAALELAPNYEEALDLLLALQGGEARS